MKKNFFIILLIIILIIKLTSCCEKTHNVSTYKKFNDNYINKTKHRIWPTYSDKWSVKFNGNIYHQKFHDVYYQPNNFHKKNLVYVVIADIDDDYDNAFEFIDWMKYKNIHLINAVFGRDNTGHPITTFTFNKYEVVCVKY
jgi:hypothetical protein